MRAPAAVPSAAAVALAASAVLVVATALLMVPVRSLEVTGARAGRLLWRVPVADGLTVDLEYTNSIFNAPTTERFAVSGRSLRLVEVSSTREAVLQYLALDPPYLSRDGRLVSRRHGQAIGELTIRIGQTGRQRLVVGGRMIPLYRVGVGEAVRLTISSVPRVLVVMDQPRPP